MGLVSTSNGMGVNYILRHAFDIATALWAVWQRNTRTLSGHGPAQTPSPSGPIDDRLCSSGREAIRPCISGS